MGFLYTELKEDKNKDREGQVTLLINLDLNKFYTVGKLISRAPGWLNFVAVMIFKATLAAEEWGYYIRKN